MNLLVDNAIFERQQHGGISRLWRALLPALQAALPDATFDPARPADWFISTYYRSAPDGVRSLVLVYDCIAERYPLIGPYHPDAVEKRRAIAAATAVVAISQHVAGDVGRWFGKRPAVAYPGIEPDYGHVRPSAIEQFQTFIGKPYFLIVGKRGLYKNVQALYQAWGRWEAHGLFKVVCIGGEEPLPQDVAFAQRYPGTWQRLALSDADLRAAYAGAQALIYPSLMEGFGLPLLEAMACGCPVLCDPAMREVTGDASIEADVTKPLSIVQALNTTLDAEVRLGHILAGLERAKHFTWDDMAQTVAGVLKETA